MKKILLAFLSACACTYVVAVLLYTQLNLANITELGVDVSLSDRLGAALHDLLGMSQIYLPIVLVALLVGFGIAALIVRWVPQLRTLGYVSAGVAAIWVVEASLSVVGSGTHPLAVTRTTVGLLSQCLAGGLGGYVFASMAAPKEGSRGDAVG